LMISDSYLKVIFLVNYIIHFNKLFQDIESAKLEL
jgi:hypothetical protein